MDAFNGKNVAKGRRTADLQNRGLAEESQMPCLQRAEPDKGEPRNRGPLPISANQWKAKSARSLKDRER
jgi:hypothetical protein